MSIYVGEKEMLKLYVCVSKACPGLSWEGRVPLLPCTRFPPPIEQLPPPWRISFIRTLHRGRIRAYITTKFHWLDEVSYVFLRLGNQSTRARPGGTATIWNFARDARLVAYYQKKKFFCSFSHVREHLNNLLFQMFFTTIFQF